MFEKSEHITEAVAVLWSHALQFDRGHLIEYSTITSLCGLDRNSGSFWHAINSFRKRMLADRGIRLRAIPNVGLEFMTNTSQVRDTLEERQRKMYRQSQRAQREVSAVEPDDLDLFHQKMRALHLDKLRQSELDIKRQVRQLVTKTNPKPHIALVAE